MCKLRPGPRCSDYAVGTLDVTQKRLDRTKNELAEYKEKYAESLAKEGEDVGKRDAIRISKKERLEGVVEAQEQALAEAEFEYHACPVGQKELNEDLEKATAEGDEAKVQELTARLEAGKEYRAAQNKALRTLDKVEEEQGPEVAQAVAMDMYEEASEEETEALIGLQQSSVELEAARAEREEYEKALEEYRANDRIDTPEEEAAKARKRKMMLTLIVVAGASVLAFSLAHQAATGKKSSILQYGRSMAMRQAMIGGRRTIGNLLQGDQKELDARERRGEQEAERRASKAREKVLQKAEQDKIVASRNAARQAERDGEIEHRRLLREEARQAEEQRRKDEWEHYQKLSTIELPPEVMQELRKRVRQPRKTDSAPAADAQPQPNQQPVVA